MSNEVHSLIVRYLIENHRGYFSLTSCNYTNYWSGARNTKARLRVTTQGGVCPEQPWFSIPGQEEADHASRIINECLSCGRGENRHLCLLTGCFAIKTQNLTSVLSEGRWFQATDWGVDLYLEQISPIQTTESALLSRSYFCEEQFARLTSSLTKT